jgi:cytochrome c556
MQKKSLSLALLLCVLGAVAIGWSSTSRTIADDQEKKAPLKKSKVVQAFMRVKLGHSQAVLDGLVTENFDRIEQNAAAMVLLTKAEQWKVSNDPQFMQYSNEFLRVTTQLAAQAKKKNLDGASLAYVELTMNCIECHRFVRDRLYAKAAAPSP